MQDDSQRLDKLVATHVPDGSRSLAVKLISEGKVSVNQKVVTKSSTRVSKQDNLSVNFKAEDLRSDNIDLPIIYEDDTCLVIDKPSGIITHPKGAYYREGSVASFARSKISPDLAGNRAGIVHRLDRGTSGIIIVAKNEESRRYLTNQFAKRLTNKTYYSIISGKLKKDKARINMPIERSPKKPSTFKTGANGKQASTTYELIASNDKYSLVKLSPETGRTHQLRVHLKAIGHPIVGDTIYGGEQAERLMLHAYKLEINIKDKGRMSFTSKLPKEFSRYISTSGLKNE